MVKNIILSLRPKQWSKNLIIFAGLIFSQNLLNTGYLLRSIAAFAIFCLLSGAVYIINDIVDKEPDRKHPVKSKRPIAAGTLKVNSAIIFAVIFTIVSLIFAYWINLAFFLVAIAYFVLMLAYSFLLKKIVILDVLIVATGFALRAFAGTVAISVEISVWLFLCAILLALFLAISKRRHELVLFEEEAVAHRVVLGEYSKQLLDQMISIVTASTLITYSIYTIAPETVKKFHTPNLVLTIPFVLYGIFRYLYLVYKKQLGGSPEKLMLEDKGLIIGILAWLLSIIVILYISK
ncbi:MAG: decaprenyl-phosphate phosphoribosyltransferase [bacterium]|nr:decaprenyl-phosphate phosphoribosyltransferase [candidate division WOR-3 bacterium]